MARMAAAAPPRLAIEQQMYVPPPRPLANTLVRHLEIEPTGRHLVVGGIGSGKTTQLLLATQVLNAMPDMCAAYIDVSSKQDLVKLKPGCLVALAGLALLEHLPPDTTGRKVFTDWANGFECEPWELEYHDGGFVEVAGAVTPPERAWRDIHAEHVRQLAIFANELHTSGRSFVALFDSLDRTSNREGFMQLVEQDIAALHSCAIGVVLIGPLRSLEGFGRLEVDRFDKLHMQAPVDLDQDPVGRAFDQDPVGRAFLFHVLRARAEESILPDDSARAIVTASGGVLRDLISIAKAAGDEAYLAGADQIDLGHVAAASDAFGRSMMVGLHASEIAALKHVHSGGGFVWTSNDDVMLVATRRVLQYPGPPARYLVHPAIGPLLAQKAS
jgi:energy-coupling factor transporter ATP-binding protein EcfA2